MKPKVVVGMSGGVDSAVAALLLRETGWDVQCIFMKNWEEDSPNPGCSSEEDYLDALQAAEVLDLPLHSVNFSQDYWDRVFTYFLEEYRAGRTPNPDVLCNREIKFKVFLDFALELGAEKIATGHYARIHKHDNHYSLLKGVDASKDQSYFLYLLGQDALSRAIFPLGELTKAKVRAIAEEAGLPNAQRKDSTGICFIGERKFRNFLENYLPAQPGDILTPEGTIVGRHKGLMYYTLGQRQGLGIGGGHGAEELPWYVAEKRIADNTLVVVQGQKNPALYSKDLTADEVHWIGRQPPEPGSRISAKIRYRQPDQPCQITAITDNRLKVRFEQPQFAVAPGQSVVFYEREECLGGAIIERASIAESVEV